MAANAHDGADIEFDEDRGGPRHIQNYLSMPVDGELYQSTKHIFPWEEAGAHEAPNTRFVVPSIYVEKIFTHAVVEAPEELKPLLWVTRCLALPPLPLPWRRGTFIAWCSHSEGLTPATSMALGV